MRSSHKESYFVKLLIGFSSIIGSIIIIFYAIFELGKDSDWYFWHSLQRF
jgi:hypothetical protein